MEKLKYKLHDNCSKIQPEQSAIVKAMEALENQTLGTPKKNRNNLQRQQSYYTINKNYRNHKILIEKNHEESIRTCEE